MFLITQPTHDILLAVPSKTAAVHIIGVSYNCIKDTCQETTQPELVAIAMSSPGTVFILPHNSKQVIVISKGKRLKKRAEHTNLHETLMGNKVVKSVLRDVVRLLKKVKWKKQNRKGEAKNDRTVN